MAHFKMIPSMKPSEIDRLDNVHRAMRNMCSPTKADLLTRLSNDLDDANFTEVDSHMNQIPSKGPVSTETVFSIPASHSPS